MSSKGTIWYKSFGKPLDWYVSSIHLFHECLNDKYYIEIELFNCLNWFHLCIKLRYPSKWRAK